MLCLAVMPLSSRPAPHGKFGAGVNSPSNRRPRSLTFPFETAAKKRCTRVRDTIAEDSNAQGSHDRAPLRGAYKFDHDAFIPTLTAFGKEET